jgi:large subunit ribosomal protein L6
MSRIGLKPVPLPSGVTLRETDGHVEVKGPKGTLSVPVPRGISVAVEGPSANVKRSDDSKPRRALHGLTRALLANAVVGVTQGYEKQMEVVGTGYRVESAGSDLKFALGYSHPVIYKLPQGVTAKVEEKNTVLILNGIDKQQIGQLCAELRALRPPDAYKGKGVKFRGEVIHLKPGKAAGK